MAEGATEACSSEDLAELRHRHHVEHARAGIAFIDGRTGRIEEVNKSLLEMLGCARDELLGKPVWEVPTLPELLPGEQAFRELCARGGESAVFRSLHTRRGIRLEVEFITKVYDCDCAQTVELNILDESKRRSAEEALQRESARSQAFLRNASDGVHILDIGGKVLEVSDAFCLMLGYSRSELLGAHVSLWDAQWSRPELDTLVKTQINGGSNRFQTRHRRRDGSLIEVEISGQPLMFDGQMVLFNSARDITARKAAEATLRLQAAALNAAANPIVITDRAGTIEWVNAAFSTSTGYSAEEAIGKNPRALIKSGLHAPEFYKEMWQTIVAGRVWHGEMQNRRKDDSVYVEDVTITPVASPGGEVSHFIAIKRDLTDERRQQMMLHQAQKMESVGRLAGGVAHDFNNLLSVILSYCDVALEDLKSGDPLREYLSEISGAGRRAAELTSQLLMFSRQHVLQPKVVNLNDVLTSMDRMLRRVLGEDIELVSVPRFPLGLVKIDPSSFEQVIMNLAVNARDAMPTGGKLTIETGEALLDEAFSRQHNGIRPGPYVMLAVSDTGIGMDQATQAKIFEPFFTTKEVGKGTGLGLATVFGIVQQSDGAIWVYSEPGKGTTFKVFLPLAAGEISRAAQPLSEVRRGTETILLVEDEEPVRQIARSILERFGYRILEAKNGLEALALAESHLGPIDLLLTDVVMPQMSGPLLARQLALVRPHTQVICMSGYTDDAVVRHGVLDSRIAFLQKPLTPEKLRRKVRDLLDQRPAGPAGPTPH